MANKTCKIKVLSRNEDAASMTDIGINLEIRFSHSTLARMADENFEESFTMGYDPIQGVTLLDGRTQWVSFDDHPPLPPPSLPAAQRPRSQESPVGQRTTAEPPENSNIPKAAPGNGHDETNDEERLNEIAATFVPVTRPRLPAQEPLASRAKAVPTSRAKANADPNTSSLPHTTPNASAQTSSSASHPVPVQTPDIDPDETEDEDWLAKGVNALIRAALPNLPRTDLESRHAPTAPSSSTQGAQMSDRRAAAGSTRESGGRGGRKRRGSDGDTEAADPTRAKKSKG